MQKNILIVDDSPTLRASVRFVLSSEGNYNIYQADNGKVALQRLKEIKAKGERINLIISDINMPEMNGLEFLRELKKPDSEFRFIPVIILTTEKEDELKKKGKLYGAAGWMVKPFKPPLLLSVVKKFIR